MPRPLLPCKWNTERLRLSDSTFDEALLLQQINDAVPQTRDCMRVEGQEIGHNSMISVLNEGYLPPIPTKSKDYFRLQSIRLDRSNELIGLLAVYHGFPNDDIF